MAMHKNRWWLTPAGVMLDAGAYVAGLEYVTQRRALVTGKSSRTFFSEAIRLLGDLPGAGLRLSPRDVAMVGDDLWNDVQGAQRAGLRGVFVLSGKHGAAELARAAGVTVAETPGAFDDLVWTFALLDGRRAFVAGAMLTVLGIAGTVTFFVRDARRRRRERAGVS